MTLGGTLIATPRAPKWKRTLAAVAAIIILGVGFGYLMLVAKNPSFIQVLLVAFLCSVFALGALLYATFA
jgi:hypothetical protein